MEKIGFRETIRLVRSDYLAVVRFYKKTPSLTNFVSFMLYPGFIAVLLYRVSHYFQRRFKIVSRLLYWLTIVLTGADMNPASSIGEGFVMLHSAGTTVSGKIGKNVLLTSGVGIGGDAGREDIGAGPGLPVLGDRVIMGARSLVLGPRRIGDDAFVCAMSFVTSHVPAGATVFGVPARRVPDRFRIREKRRAARFEEEKAKQVAS